MAFCSNHSVLGSGAVLSITLTVVISHSHTIRKQSSAGAMLVTHPSALLLSLPLRAYLRQSSFYTYFGILVLLGSISQTDDVILGPVRRMTPRA